MNQSLSVEEDAEDILEEDYFFGDTESRVGSHKLYALVIYDISDNKKRTQFAKYMQAFGTRVQKSCFEVVLGQPAYNKMMKGIGRYCGAEDSIRLYRIPGKSQVHQWGVAGPLEEEDVIVL
ncbi:MAG: CRISPR-associated endonuclease Cas2 [Selenomonadaceae bacterium]|nr:CRISPR-associated endonuclease Cas2 [Selenomonadaceae bacterium]